MEKENMMQKSSRDRRWVLFRSMDDQKYRLLECPQMSSQKLLESVTVRSFLLIAIDPII